MTAVFKFDKIDYKYMKTDLVKNAMVIIVSALLKFYFVDRSTGSIAEVLNQKMLILVGLLLIGHIAYHVFVHPHLDVQFVYK